VKDDIYISWEVVLKNTLFCSVESDDSTRITISEGAIISLFEVEELDRSTQ
jgi:hypothetical protein